MVNPNLQYSGFGDVLAQYDVAFDGVITSPLRRCSDFGKLICTTYSRKVSVCVAASAFPGEMNL
ncbi:hypothetical protein O9929_17350 [Vibrio lentus]|nr:hypothetical protein [Vibrio lentus]